MINWSNCPEVESVAGQSERQLGIQRHQVASVFPLREPGRSGATIYDFMEWFEGVDESDVKAVLEFVAQDLRARVPDAHTVR